MSEPATGLSIPDRAFLLNAPLDELMREASRIRRQCCGNKMHVCSIMNAKSGACSEDCAFCAQSGRHATGIPAYPLKSVGEIIAAAEAAHRSGARHFGIVCSGNRPSQRDLQDIREAVRAITQRCDIRVCGSMGALEADELSALRAAGLARYHHNIETSPRYYAEIVTTHRFEDRIRTIQAAHAAGLEVCSGVIIGMGETWDDRIEMALLLRDLPVVSVPVNILVPIRGTRLEHRERMTCVDILRCIALFRIILGGKVMKIAAGRETVLHDFQSMGFSAGANGMLIGGYLTVKGRDVETDQRLIRDVQLMWESGL